jgi:hypothetical protein
VPNDIVLKTDKIEDGYFVKSENLDEIKITNIKKQDYK